MTDELKERVKALAVEAGGVPLRENCLDADAFPWGVEMEIDALVRVAQAVARECAKLADDKALEIRLYCNEAHVVAVGAAIRARYGLGD